MTTKEKKQKKARNPKGKKVKRTIAFALTDAEFATKGKEAAEIARNVSDLEVEFEGVKDVWRARIKNAEAKRDTVLDAIRKGTEDREVDVVEVKNFEQETVEYYLAGEKVDERKMEDRDRQEELKLKEAKKAKRKSGAPVVPNDEAAAANQATEAPTLRAVTDRDMDIAQTHREETSARGSWSTVNGARG